MRKMIATSLIDYPPEKRHKPGELFEVEEAHVALFETLGRAKRFIERPAENETRDMVAGSAASYETRDMDATRPKRRGGGSSRYGSVVDG